MGRLKRLTVPQYIALGFALTILVGAVLLSLPISSQSGQATGFLDALFTATSAVCVTGQVTLNTAAHWNYFGKTVIITLIEIGGLGFMSIIVMLFVFLGKKLNLRQRLIVREAVNTDDLSDAQFLIRYIIRFALTIQVMGAALLSIEFIPRYGLLKGIYFSIFHSISAFCNAGFDLFGNSLEGFTQTPLVVLTIGGLIVVGGLGFIVWRDVLSYRKNKKLLMHTKLTLITTFSILIISFFLFWLSESRNGTFADLPLQHQIVNYLFMAITPRTAGYANVNYATVSSMGIFVTILLMFVGASSGSTGGGVKVTTVATIVLWFKAKLRGDQVHFKNRSISQGKVEKAFMIVFSGIMMVLIASLILLITEEIPPQFGIEYVLVEVFSCFGTVGLTMGLTPDLTAIGKIVLIILMFAGRIGMLTFFLSFSGKGDTEDPLIRYPEGNILIG